MNVDLACYDFATGFEQNRDRAVYALQALLLDEGACRARIALLNRIADGFPRTPLPCTGFEFVIRAICEVGIFRALSDKTLTIEVLVALSCDPVALWHAHLAVVADTQQLLADAVWARELNDFPKVDHLLRKARIAATREDIRLRCDAEEARLKREMGEFDLAEDRFLGLLDQPNLPLDLQVFCYNNLAWLVRQKKQLDQGEQYLRRAARLAEDYSGKISPLLASETVHQWAVLERECGRLEKARTLISEALSIRLKHDTPEQLNVARSLRLRGLIQISQQDSGAALADFRRALEIRTAALGQIHVDVADLHYNVGATYESLGQWELAHESFARAAEVYDTACKTPHAKAGAMVCHASYVACQGKLAHAAAQLGRVIEARELASKWLPCLLVLQYNGSETTAATKAKVVQGIEAASPYAA